MSSSVVRKYEGMFLVDSALVTGNWNNVVSSIETVLKRANAEVVSMKKWDDRRLCYPISGVQRGTYVLVYFNTAPASIAGIERDVQISEDILRVMILRADVIPQEIIDAPTPLESGCSRVGEFQSDVDGDVERDDIEDIDVPSIDDIE